MNTPVADLLFASLFSSQNTKKKTTTTIKQLTNHPDKQTKLLWLFVGFFLFFCFGFAALKKYSAGTVSFSPLKVEQRSVKVANQFTSLNKTGS